MHPEEPSPAGVGVPSDGGTGYRALLFGTIVAAAAVGLLLLSSRDLGGELILLGAGAAQVAPFVVLAMAAYLAENSRPLRFLTAVLLLGLVGSLVLVSLAFGVFAVVPTATIEAGALPPGIAPTVLALFGLGSLFGLASFVGLLRPVRRGVARYLPLDPASFVQAVALVLVIALILIPPVPLIVNGAPPLLSPNVLGSGALGQSPGELARAEAYSLLFIIYASFLVVGLFVRRNFAEALERLAFVRPTARQVLFALGMAVVLVVVFGLLDRAIALVWGALGWPVTDEAAYRQLFSGMLTPAGAVTAAVSAGVGEELAVRGVLQPVFGMVLPSLLFAALHAWQYSWDGLVSVFLAGLVFAWIRRRANTTTSAITHATYDLILFGALAMGSTI
ncbi:MAG: CPBP family intramembrane glutamic endopeptidase [Methanospirillum sp.]